MILYYFRQQLTQDDEEPDLVMLSVVAGHVENCMTTLKNISNTVSRFFISENYFLVHSSVSCLFSQNI